MERLLTIIRKPTGLFALVSRERFALACDAEAFAQMPPFDDVHCLYDMIEVPLASVSSALCPRKEALLVSWNALRAVRIPHAETLYHVLVVLQATTPNEAESLALPPFTAERASDILPTAAHPRAYKGTKSKPPRPKSPPLTDLRPYLCSPAGENTILSELDEFRPLALQIWQRQRPGEAVPTQMSATRFPALFRRLILPSLRGLSDTDLSAYLTLYWDLQFERNTALLHAIAYLISLQCCRKTLAWCRFLAEQPEEIRTTFATLLVHSKAYLCDMASLSTQEKACFTALLDGPHYAYRLYCLFLALQKGVSLDYMMQGYQIADGCDANYEFHTVTQSRFFPRQAAVQFMEHIRPSTNYYPTFGLKLWALCGQMDGLGEILQAVRWKRYAPETANEFLALYTSMIYDEVKPDLWGKKWAFLRGQTERIETLLARLPPEYHAKCLDFIGDCFWFWDRTIELTEKMPRAYALIERLAQPPFKKETNTKETLRGLVYSLNELGWERLLHAPDASFSRLETVCRLENNARLIQRGLASLARHDGLFTVASFYVQTNRLFKTAKLIGCLSEPICDRLASAFASSPERRAASFEDYQARPRLLLSHLEALEAQGLQTLQAGFRADLEIEQDTIRHALQIQRWMDDNRRCLRSFLKAYWAGKHDYVLTHPLTKAWLKKHPALTIQAWLDGLSYTPAANSLDIVRIEIEKDPLEALKLGTYVGSCLGLGGNFADSAVAAVLDINKRVLYARNHKGNVIARQVVAISEEEELVCFQVYPYSIAPTVKRMFVEADKQLAAKLGLELYEKGWDGQYKITSLLADYWWDDGAWDFDVN